MSEHTAFGLSVTARAGAAGPNLAGDWARCSRAARPHVARLPRRRAGRLDCSAVQGRTPEPGDGGEGAAALPTNKVAPPRRGVPRILLLRVWQVLRRMSPIGIVFFAMTYFWSLVLFVPMAIAHPWVLLLDRSRRTFHDVIASAWMRLSLGSAMIRHRVVNSHLLPAKGVPAVYVANHSSYIDIYAMSFLRRRLKYVSKAEIFRMPVVGWAMQMAGNVALRRASKRGQMEAYRGMLAVLASGISLVVFPEGTRSSTGRLQRFHAGAFRAAKSAGVPVVPVTIDGTRQMMPADALLPVRFPWNGITLTVHEPIPTTDRSIEDVKKLAFKAIDSALDPALQSTKSSG